MLTFMTNNEWAENKSYDSFADYTADNNPKPNAKQLDTFRANAYFLLCDRVGPDTLRSALSSHLQGKYKALEYLLVEKLRLKEIIKKSKETKALQDEIAAIISLIPQKEAQDLSLDADDGSLNRGCVE